MIIVKKALSRRTVLRGVGTALALPLLDSMVPALSAFDKTAAAPVNRFGVVYSPNGKMMSNWTPTTEGTNFELSPTLKSLAPFREHLLVLSGLSCKPDETVFQGGHSRASTRFLTDTQPKPTKGSDAVAGISMDQIAAKELAQHTQLASLELALEFTDTGGTGDPGFSKVYVDTISWRSNTTPLPMENNPRVVFERMFGDSGNTDPAARLSRLKQDRSILDSVAQTASADLQRKLGTGDRLKLNEYFEAIRDVERRVQKAEEQNAGDRNAVPTVEHPAGIPASYVEHTKLMYDLYVLAYQADLTRVITFMTGFEYSGRTYREVGVPDAHHSISHHQGDPERLEKQAKIDVFNTSLFAYFVEKMRTTPDGDGSLLDHAMIVYGAGMSDSNAHDYRDLPILLIGGGCGKLKGGNHIRFAKDTPLANLHVTLLDKLGVHVEKIGDSSGELQQLSF